MENLDFLYEQALEGIVEGQAAMGDFAGARATTKCISESFYKAQAFIAIAAAQEAETGDKDEARATLEEAKSASMNISVQNLRRLAFKNIGKVYAIIGDFPNLQKWAEITTDPLILTNIYLGGAEGLIEQENHN